MLHVVVFSDRTLHHHHHHHSHLRPQVHTAPCWLVPCDSLCSVLCSTWTVRHLSDTRICTTLTERDVVSRLSVEKLQGVEEEEVEYTLVIKPATVLHVDTSAGLQSVDSLHSVDSRSNAV